MTVPPASEVAPVMPAESCTSPPTTISLEESVVLIDGLFFATVRTSLWQGLVAGRVELDAIRVGHDTIRDRLGAGIDGTGRALVVAVDGVGDRAARVRRRT